MSTILTPAIAAPETAATRGDGFLRLVLAADAATSAGAGLLLLAVGGWLAPWLGLTPAFLASAGLALLPFAGLVAWLAAAERPRRAALWAVVGANFLWAAESILLLLGGWIEPTGIGTVVVVAQAAAVAAIADLQLVGLVRMTRAAR